MDKTTVKQLAEQLGQVMFNLANWTQIATMTIDDDKIVGTVAKVSGKQIKSQLRDTTRTMSNLIHALSKEVGNIV